MKRLLLVLVLLVSFFAVSAASAQSDSVVVRVNPDSTQIALNQAATIAVEVVDVIDVYAIDITLTFDPTVLEVVDADPDLEGVQISLGEFLDPGFVIINQADNDAGVLRLAMSQLNPSTPKNGTGNLIVINFRGKTLSAETDLEFVSVKMARNNGALIENTTEPGTAEVVDEIPGPTNTPIPTQGAGTPLPTSTLRPTSAPTRTSQPGVSATPKPATATAATVPTDPPTATFTATMVESSTPEVQNSPTFTSTPLENNATEIAQDSSLAVAEKETQVPDAVDDTQRLVQTDSPNTYPPLLMLAIGVSGALIGGLIVYFIGLRRRDDEKQPQNESKNDD